MRLLYRFLGCENLVLTTLSDGFDEQGDVFGVSDLFGTYYLHDAYDANTEMSVLSEGDTAEMLITPELFVMRLFFASSDIVTVAGNYEVLQSPEVNSIIVEDEVLGDPIE